jgi:hypothetical protein
MPDSHVTCGDPPCRLLLGMKSKGATAAAGPELAATVHSLATKCHGDAAKLPSCDMRDRKCEPVHSICGLDVEACVHCAALCAPRCLVFVCNLLVRSSSSLCQCAMLKDFSLHVAYVHSLSYSCMWGVYNPLLCIVGLIAQRVAIRPCSIGGWVGGYGCCYRCRYKFL